MARFRTLAVTLAAALVSVSVVRCGGDSQPTAPTPQPASVSLTSVTAAFDPTDSEHRYRIRLTVRETGGQSAVTLGTVDLNFAADGAPGGTVQLTDAWSSTRLTAGASMDSRNITITDDRAGRPIFTRVTARVAFTDDRQTTASSTGNADISMPAVFTLHGVVSEDPDNVPILDARVEVISGVNAGRFSATDGNGYYSIPELRVAGFTIRASKPGFQAVERTVTGGSAARFDILLRSLTPAPVPPPSNSSTCTGVPGSVSCGTPTARCRDGAWSCSRNRSGTCSSHGGVACWVCPGPLCQS